MVRKKPLGKGLDALLGHAHDAKESSEEHGFQEVGVLEITPNPNQPRSKFDREAIEELAHSIADKGVLQPLILRPLKNGKYELIAGERRWLAAKQARLDTVPAIVREVDERESMVLALVENLQREDLNAFEQANALQELVVKYELTHEQIGKLVGKSRTAVTNTVRLMQLHKTVLKQLAEGALDEGHARALLGLEKPAQVIVAAKIVKGGLSVRQTETLVRKLKENEGGEGTTNEKDRDVINLENELSDLLGVSIAIHSGKKSGTGRMTIRYQTLDELDDVIKRLRQS